ncbi:MAG: imidazole glycerol phosphate synthase subunit HisH [Deltaproteobacteria bacterium]|nr:imidazole glycerol phosphate synthase subunit HisH [Deltaproteobacteria bacterium]
MAVGLVDYGVGNHSSVHQSLQKIGVRCRVSDDPAVLSPCDLLLLPGVGAFRPAMEALKRKGLDRYLVERASKKRPIVGICLGMQLLTEGSYEGGFTPGLGLIPGEIVPLGPLLWHIGWNTVTRVTDDPLFEGISGQTFYFNHAYKYHGPQQFKVCTTRVEYSFASVVRRNKIIGLQFHPEKSQDVGNALLRRVIEELCRA